MGINRIEEVRVYKNRFVSFYDDAVEFPSGHRGSYVRMAWRANYSVGIIPINKENEIVFINQFCYAAQKWFLQIPKGIGETRLSPEEVAIKELKEELGGAAERIDLLFSLFTDPGIIESPTHIFVARGLVCNQHFSREPSEVIGNLESFTIDELLSRTTLSRIQDSLTLASLMRFIYSTNRPELSRKNKKRQAMP